MIWLTWRQSRFAVLAVAVLVAAMAMAYVVTHGTVLAMARDAGYLNCATGCDVARRAFAAAARSSVAFPLFILGLALLYLAPAVVGAFWGAPMVAREFENGTFRLIWNQTVSRGRWLTVKLAVLGLAAVAVTGLLSLAVTWWSGLIDQATDGRMQPLFFGSRGVAPIGYAAFAFTLGVACGLLLRRTLAAMAVTIVVVAALQALSPLLLRPYLITHSTQSTAITADAINTIGYNPQTRKVRVGAEPPADGSWVLATETVDAAGNPLDLRDDGTHCGPGGKGPGACQQWIAAQHPYQRVAYVPASRFWTLQWREFGIFLLISFGLAGLSVWWVRRRVA